jgi:hypothetical protein
MTIAMHLTEDESGANGRLGDEGILDRLVANIHEQTGHKYVETGAIPVRHAARIIWSVWRDMQDQLDEETRMHVNLRDAVRQAAIDFNTTPPRPRARIIPVKFDDDAA